jgi:hypothetical protein
MGEGYALVALRTNNPSFGRRGAAGRRVATLFAAVFCLSGLDLSARADPISELRSVSVFKDADLTKLTNGEVLASKGPAMSSSRGLSVETAYIVKAPVKTTYALQARWNPTGHPELKVTFPEEEAQAIFKILRRSDRIPRLKISSTRR